MINFKMRPYTVRSFDGKDEYGMAALSQDSRTILMAIYKHYTDIIDSVRFQNIEYIGFTTEPISEKDVVDYGDEKLKVSYVIKDGRLNQVFLANEF